MAGRLGTIDWLETADELEGRFKQAPTVAQRKRLQVLWLVSAGSSARAAARLAGVGERTVIRWLGWYRAGGLRAVLEREPGHSARGRPSLLTGDQEAALRRALLAGEIHGVQSARRWIQRELGVSYSYHGAYALLKRLSPAC